MQQQSSVASRCCLSGLADFIADVAGMWTRSRPLARPSQAFTFGRMELPLLPIAFPASRLVAFATSKPFAGGLHRSRSVGLTAFAVGKSFSPFPKWLKSQTAQVISVVANGDYRDWVPAGWRELRGSSSCSSCRLSVAAAGSGIIFFLRETGWKKV